MNDPLHTIFIFEALGFYHMQSAYDRDEYVKIQWDHIIEGREYNFQKFSSNQVSHFNSTYDYGSLMHYHEYAFSKDGVATIVPLVSVPLLWHVPVSFVVHYYYLFVIILDFNHFLVHIE